MSKKKYYLPILFFLYITLFLSCNQNPELNWDSYVNDFVESYFKQNPDWAVLNGRHDYDGQISDYSDKGIKERVMWFKNQKKLTDGFDDKVLTKEQILEKKNLLRVIDENIFLMEIARNPYNNANYYAWQMAPSLYLEKNYAPFSQRMKGYINYLHSVKIAVKQIQTNFENESPLARYNLEIAKIVFGGFRDFIKTDAPKGFESVKDDSLWVEFNNATKEAIDNLNEFVKWLDNQIPNAPTKFAIGPDKFSQMLYATDRIKIPLSELKIIAEDDLNRNLSALETACQKYSPGKSVEDCMKMFQSQKKDYDPIKKAREQLPILEKFLKEKNIVSILDYTSLSVTETPSFLRGYSAAVVLPYAFDKDMEGIYYITSPDPEWSAQKRKGFLMEENILLNTSVHEAWPGHFLHSLYFNRCKSPLAKIFKNYTCLEGWAHYSEEMMFEEGLGDNKPEFEIAIRSDALLRNVRFLVAIKMHTEGMTVNEAQNMFLNYAFQDSATAENEALRGTYDPQYYVYTLGKLLIRKLKNDWMAKTKSSDLKEFHTKFLSYGVIPIPLIEESMLTIN